MLCWSRLLETFQPQLVILAIKWVLEWSQNIWHYECQFLHSDLSYKSVWKSHARPRSVSIIIIVPCHQLTSIIYKYSAESVFLQNHKERSILLNLTEVSLGWKLEALERGKQRCLLLPTGCIDRMLAGGCCASALHSLIQLSCLKGLGKLFYANVPKMNFNQGICHHLACGTGILLELIILDQCFAAVPPLLVIQSFAEDGRWWQ